ncbi:MAG: NIL domain-containing protein [bacterium]
MEISKKIVLIFPAYLAEKPITYHLIKDYDLVLNILRAKVTPNTEGRLVIELTGEEDKINEGIEYIRAQHIEVKELAREIVLDELSCMHCGVCNSVCSVGALRMSPKDFKLEFNRDKCILCEQCVDVCPVNAITVMF